MTEKNESIRILTYNLGLLKWKLFGIGPIVYQNPPYADERFPFMAKALLESKADILVLQEVYRGVHVQELQKQLKETHPYMARGSKSRPWQFHNALVVFSKYEITNFKLVKHKDAEWTEKALASKCMQVVEVSTPLGPFQLVCMHTTAGGNYPEEADEIRESELIEAIEECKAYSSKPGNEGRAIITGDLNMGPQASRANYDFMLESGFVDAVANVTKKELTTWDPVNLLNAFGVHNHCPPQQCDHLFLQKDSSFHLTEAELFMTDAFISIGGGEKVTLSDHYGINMVLTKK